MRLTPGCMTSVIPEGIFGKAKIVHDEPDELTRLRAARDGQPLRAPKYTRLLIDGHLWMTDAEFECWTNMQPVKDMRGDVLIAGLGIGLILHPLIRNPLVNRVAVLERDADVIGLVTPHLPKGIEIIEADAYTWQPPKKAFDSIYFDIWKDVPSEDNREEIKALKKRYRPALRPGGWMHAWCEKSATGRRR